LAREPARWLSAATEKQRGAHPNTETGYLFGAEGCESAQTIGVI
jgi:hypothetical protein